MKLRGLFCIFLLLLQSTCWGGAPIIAKLVVNGTAQLQKPADQIGLTVTVLTQADTVEKALGDNNDKMQQVIDSLLLAGLEKGEYHTGQFSIQPIYAPPPRNIPPDWKAHIVSYEVTNSLNIKTQNLELAPTIIDAAGLSGANQISNISFGIKDPSIYRSEAITQAAAHAMKDANVLAEATNIKIVRVLDIKLDQPQIYPRPGPNLLYMAKADHAPFIEAPDVDLTANVSVTFEIAPK